MEVSRIKIEMIMKGYNVLKGGVKRDKNDIHINEGSFKADKSNVCYTYYDKEYVDDFSEFESIEEIKKFLSGY